MILAAAALAAVSPSFDCSKATGAVEHMICASEARAIEDRAIAALYGLVRKQHSEVRAEQVKYLHDRDTCKDESCLIDAQEWRIMELLKDVRASSDFSMGRYGTLRVLPIREGIYVFTVQNLWVGTLEGDVRDAEASGAFRLVEGKGERLPTSDFDSGWRLTKIRGGWRVQCLPDLTSCGGVNATIDGDYR